MAEDKVTSQVESMEEIDAGVDVEYAFIEGFTPDKPFRIGSVTAGDIIEWSEASEGEAKRTMGLRLICKSLVNSKNERFASDFKNLAIFRRKSHKITERIVREILKLNGMNVKAEVEVKKD